MITACSDERDHTCKSSRTWHIHPSIERSRLEEKARTNARTPQANKRPSGLRHGPPPNLAGVCADKRYRHAMCFKRHGTHAVHRSTHRTSPRRSCRHRRPRQPPAWRRYRPWLRVSVCCKNEAEPSRAGRASIYSGEKNRLRALLYVHVQYMYVSASSQSIGPSRRSVSRRDRVGRRDACCCIEYRYVMCSPVQMSTPNCS